MTEPIIRIENLSKSFQGQPVLTGVNLSVPAGGITVVIGKSGGGKSVLLKHIIGLMQPDSGEIYIAGQALSGLRGPARHALRRKCSYMFQGMALFDSLTVFDNVALPLREKTKLTKTAIADRVMEKIERLDLGEVAGKYPSQISGGMQKRVALARALITEPEIVLFDEPTTGLDPLRKTAVLELITQSKAQFGFTAILVSHDIPRVFGVATRVAMLSDGAIVFEGTPEEALESDAPALKEFLAAGPGAVGVAA
jgi:phospholipid/cholesterol/gamma-HCH transport system ATP-binding protein